MTKTLLSDIIKTDPISDAMAELYIDVFAAVEKAIEAGDPPLDVYGNLTSQVVGWTVRYCQATKINPELTRQLLDHAVNNGVHTGLNLTDKEAMN